MGDEGTSGGAVTVRSARAGELAGVLELIVSAFGERSRERMRTQLFEDSGHRLDQSRLLEVGGVPASYVRVSARPLHYGTAIIPAAGIGAVSTAPVFRGRGYATMVLRDCIDYMRGAGYPLSLLFTGIQGFYARLGWAPFPEYAWHVPVPAERDSRAGTPAGAPEAGPWRGSAARLFNEEKDLTGVEQVYAAYSACRTGAVARDPAYWRDGQTRCLGILPRFVVERGGTIVAYVSMRGGDPRAGTPDGPPHCEVHEAGCLPGEEAAFRPLAGAVLAQAHKWGATEVMFRTGNRHGLLAAVTAAAFAGGAPPAHAVVRQNMMLMLHDLPALVRAALPALQQRLDERPWLGGLRAAFGLHVAGQDAWLSVEGGRVAAGRAQGSTPLSLEEGLFWRLFLGASSVLDLAEEMAGQAGTRLSADEMALLDALFPPQDPHFWRADHF
jgi:predicted N-acetyltransferase YhbS